MTKEEIRIAYKEKRKSVSIQEIEKFNDLILINFQKIRMPFISCVHTYLASLKLAEPDTATIIRFLQFQNPEVKVVIPKVDIRSGTLQHYHFNETVELMNNRYGIEEPREGIKIMEEEIDLVLVPLLAFDRNGFRVGYGKGYYDRFLFNCRKDALKVGLSFFEPVDEIEDIDQFDISLNYCVTPQQLYVF